MENLVQIIDVSVWPVCICIIVFMILRKIKDIDKITVHKYIDQSMNKRVGNAPADIMDMMVLKNITKGANIDR